MSDADFAAVAAHLAQAGIATPTANLFVPQTIKVVGPDIDVEQQAAHVERVMTRLSRLGVEVLVFGSGGARRVPDGFPRDQAWKQLVEFSRRAAQQAKPYGIVITIEPLRKEETNIVNTAAEGLDALHRGGHPSLAHTGQGR